MNHRFTSNLRRNKAFICLLCVLFLSMCIIGTSFTAESISQPDNDYTTALSFSSSAQWMADLDTTLSMRFFTLFPAQKTTAEQKEPIMLYPGGQPVGILLRTDGILVVGYSPVKNETKELHPAQSAGIQAGDIIFSVNNTQVVHDDELAMLINELGAQGDDISLEIRRGNHTLHKNITPVYCDETDSYRIGLLIRDNAGGVGTLTFVNPKTMQYGALGHMIANNDTQLKLSILNGKLVAADIQGIKKGLPGTPGEKIGRFVNNTALGSIDKNTSAGIFGTLTDSHILSETVTTHPLHIASSNEVYPGSATIYTALDGMQVNSYTVEIEKVNLTNRDGKNMVIRITDPELLRQTGGIVQGMSGSPIIQNGKIIGAVTHVLVNDPTRGYGIFIENMLDVAG